MFKDIYIVQNHNHILMKEKFEQSPWTVMKSQGNEDMLSKIMTVEHNFVVVRDEMVSYEYCMQHVAQNVEEIDDGEILMLCSDQQKGRMLEKILTETSESHVFETDY